MRLQLSDGRVVPIVKPHLGDQLAVEREMGLKPHDFQQHAQTAAFQTAFSVYATLNRNGIDTRFKDVLEIDIESLSGLLEREDGDPKAEDEQRPDPPKKATSTRAAKKK